MSTVLANAVTAILEHPEGGTLLELRRFLVDEAYRKAFLAGIPDAEVQFFWTKEWPLIGSRSIGPILTRLNAFLRPKVIRHIVGQKRPKLDFASVMGERKIFLAKLSQGLIGNENAYLMGSLLLSRFLQLALSRQRVARDERAPFWLYLDEAEHFVTRSVASLLTEARKYGVGLHLAFQMLSQLKSVPEVESAVMGSAHTRIVFRVGDDDARRLEGGFAHFDADDLRGLGRGEAIVRLGDAQQDCNLHTVRVPDVDPRTARNRREQIVDLSRSRYAVPTSVLAVELGQPHEATSPSPLPASEPPQEQTTDEASSLIVPPPAHTKERPPPEPRRTAKAPEQPAPLGRGGPEHKYLQHLIQRLAEERGFRAVIEEPVPDGQVDVALRRGNVSIACEVSVTTDFAHELENVEKCMRAGFNHVWLVVPDRKRRENLNKTLASRANGRPVKSMTADELVGALDAFGPTSTASERIIGGYKVKVTRRVPSPEEIEKRHSTVAEVIAKSLLKRRDK